MPPRDNDSSQETFDPELDLLERYEAMVETQVETLNGIDDKAAYIARLVGILAGLVTSAASILVGTQGVQFTTQTRAVFLMLALAVVSFFVSLIYAIITYLSSRFEYGPKATLGEFMADYQIGVQTYKEMMLRGYSEAIQANRQVVVTNAKRFERCLASFLNGVLFLFGSGALIVLPPSWLVDSVVVIGFSISSLIITRYILAEEYLTLERELSTDE